MKTYEKDLRWHGATRSIQCGGLPVATNVDPEFGQLLGASAELARELIETRDALTALRNAVQGTAASEWQQLAEPMRRAMEIGGNPSPSLKKAGVL